MPPFHLTLLGDMRVRDSAGADITPRGRKMRALIGYLARLPAHAAGRERLVGLLWSDRGEAQARASLRQALADLKDQAPAAAPLVVATRQDVALATGAWRADTMDLDAALDGADAATLAARLSALDGALLADLDGLSPAFDDWLRGERARFGARLSTAALAVAEACPDREPARTIATALQRLADDPEAAVRLGMRLDHAVGDLASMHRRYRLLEAQLARDFDAEPSSATRLLLIDLSATPPAPAAATTASDAGFADGGGAAGGGAAGGGAPVIVVSPFAVLDGDGDAQALSRVLLNDIEAALNRLPDIRVLSLSHPTSERLERVSRRAIASYSLSGSIRPGALGRRVNLRLVELGEERVVWSHQIDAGPDQIGAVLDDVVDRVAGAMLPTVERDLIASRRLEAAAPAAYALYLRGRVGVLTARTLAEAQGAAAHLEQALLLDPGFVNARLHLVLCYNSDFLQRIAGHDPAPWRARALKLAQEAVQLEPHNADARARLGWCHLRHGQWDRAEALLREALALGPNHADNVEQCGLALTLIGHASEGRRCIQRAFELNPFPRSDYFADVALSHALEGNPTAALEQFELGSDPSPQYLAIETACLGLLQRQAAPARAAELREGLLAIWQGPRPFHDGDIPEAIFKYLPLRDPSHRAIVVDGLRAAGLQVEHRLSHSLL